MASDSYLAGEVVAAARDKIIRAFLNFTTTSSRDDLRLIDDALLQIDRAYRRLVPVYEEESGLIGYRDCEHHTLRWFGSIERLAQIVEEIYAIPEEKSG